MLFESILYDRAAARPPLEPDAAPACFADLHLDQVVEAITAGKQEYNLKPLFYQPLHDAAAIAYRHAVMQDLERKEIRSLIEDFASAMRSMREHLAQAAALYHERQQQIWFVDAVGIYCQALKEFAASLRQVHLAAPGLIGLRAYVTSCVESDRFGALAAGTEQVQAVLATVHYCLHVKGSTVQVRPYAGESDLSAIVAATFARFAHGAARDYSAAAATPPAMNHVETQILERVALLYPQVFAALAAYRERNRDYLDRAIAAFDREVQFYLAWLDFAALFRRRGLAFCYPQIAAAKEVYADAAYDLALACRLLSKGAVPVTNDFHLRGEERICVVSGPNQGGKTTFARLFGQLHYLAGLGCPVPGRRARLVLCDRIFTHFAAEEEIANGRGKLQDELLRMHQILAGATPCSIVIVNEIFTSTTLQDAIFLGKQVMAALMALDVLGVCVTFLDELASLGPQTVSMLSTVEAGDPLLPGTARRTYKIVRQPADGLAYAIALAEQHGLTYAALRLRFRP